ncbi:MAG: hypothetical protein ACT4TC_17255 [Myxococcaceae bacterium]
MRSVFRDQTQLLGRQRTVAQYHPQHLDLTLVIDSEALVEERRLRIVERALVNDHHPSLGIGYERR